MTAQAEGRAHSHQPPPPQEAISKFPSKPKATGAQSTFLQPPAAAAQPRTICGRIGFLQLPVCSAWDSWRCRGTRHTNALSASDGWLLCTKTLPSGPRLWSRGGRPRADQINPSKASQLSFQICFFPAHHKPTQAVCFPSVPRFSALAFLLASKQTCLSLRICFIVQPGGSRSQALLVAGFLPSAQSSEGDSDKAKHDRGGKQIKSWLPSAASSHLTASLSKRTDMPWTLSTIRAL